MTEPETRLAGSHRRNSSARRVRLLVSLLVVVLAAGGVLAALHLRGESSKPKTPVAASSHTSSLRPPTGSPSASVSVSPVPSLSAPVIVSNPPPVVSTSPASTSPASVSPASVSPAPSTSASVARPSVDILNDTHISGLAASAAKTLTSGGWTVAETGNYPHSVSTTTVFYPPDQVDAAKQLAQQYGAIREVLAAPSGVSTTDLTLVLATDWTTDGK
ncbi:MAG TPA: LytR C-terminal domain-containing protein [Acidothermaceae bacterium]